MEVKSFFVQDTLGNTLPGAECYLYKAGTEELAAVVQDVNNQPLAQPFYSDSSGLVQFQAANGFYDLKVTRGERSFTLRLGFFDGGPMPGETRMFVGEVPAGWEVIPTAPADIPALTLMPTEHFIESTTESPYAWKYHPVTGQIFMSVALTNDARIAALHWPDAATAPTIDFSFNSIATTAAGYGEFDFDDSGRYVVSTGSYSTQYDNLVYAYDLEQNRLTRLADNDQNTDWRAAGFANMGDNKFLKLSRAGHNCRIYDFNTNTWSNADYRPSYGGPSPVEGGKLFVTSTGRVIAIGGTVENTPVYDVDEYIPATDSWDKLVTLPAGTTPDPIGAYYVVEVSEDVILISAAGGDHWGYTRLDLNTLEHSYTPWSAMGADYQANYGLYNHGVMRLRSMYTRYNWTPHLYLLDVNEYKQHQIYYARYVGV